MGAIGNLVVKNYSKNSVTQTTVVRKIFTKVVRTPVWVSSCWPDRESASTDLVVFPHLFWWFIQFGVLVMPHPSSEENTNKNFARLYFNWFWLHLILNISQKKYQGKLQVKGLPDNAFKAFSTACWQWLKWELRQSK